MALDKAAPRNGTTASSVGLIYLNKFGLGILQWHVYPT